MKHKFRSCLVAIAIGLTTSAAPLMAPASAQERVAQRPNILLIVADDLGYADLGSYGSEIRTPNIDSLSKTGTKFTNYYVTPGCSPTRAMLMSGADNHTAGMGVPEDIIGQLGRVPNKTPLMTKFQPLLKGNPNYAGSLSSNIVALPELMRRSGYRTYMTGKWHLGAAADKRPNARGFDKSFAMLGGAGSHFDDAWKNLGPFAVKYTVDDVDVPAPTGMYSTTLYTDRMLDFISNDDKRSKDQPFFAYLAYSAPHDPLHVPDADVDLYKGKYAAGYEAIRSARLTRMQSLGLLKPGQTSAPRHRFVRPWDELTAEEKLYSAREMEIYAAMVEVMDREIGRVIAKLKASGEFDNTIIVFQSDNGAAFASSRAIGLVEKEPPGGQKARLASMPQINNKLENVGRPMSYNSYMGGWSQVSNGPFDWFKGNMGEGGKRSPLIVSGPNIAKGQTSDALTYVADILPTVLDYTGGKADPKSPAIAGKSLKPVLLGKAKSVRGPKDMIAQELMLNRSVRMGNWKLRWMPQPLGSGQWELFDLAKDPGETKDVIAKNAKIAKPMIAFWDNYAKSNGVITVAP
jgi:arylsulfatase A-like enzyme